MTIAKRPKGSQADIDAFISGSSTQTVRKEAPAAQAAPATKGQKRTPIIIRVPPDLLAKIDVAAKKRGLSRAGLFVSVLSRALESGEV